MPKPALTAPFYPDKLDLMRVLEADGQPHPVRTVADWHRRRAHILANLQLVMGELPSNRRPCPLDMQILEKIETAQCVRLRIAYTPEPGDRVPTYLFIPRHLTGKAPGVLCLHQTTALGKGEPAGVGGLPNLHYALELAQRGYVTLAPDYPNFGDYECDPYAHGYASATMKGIINHRRALDLLQSLPEVDTERLGCLGHSLGGHNTLFLAAFDKRVKVAVTSCGFTCFSKYYGGDLAGWSHKGYMPRILDRYHCNPAEMPFDFPEILGAIAPRAVFINAPLRDGNFEWTGVDDCVQAAQPVYELLGAAGELVCARPDSEHDFPPTVRDEAYAFLDRRLKRN